MLAYFGSKAAVQGAYAHASADARTFFAQERKHRIIEKRAHRGFVLEEIAAAEKYEIAFFEHEDRADRVGS